VSNQPDGQESGVGAFAWVVALAYVAVQLLVVNLYGYFRDELYYLACGDHLAWGYVDHPPMVALIARFSRTVFGESLLAIRVLSAIAGGATILLTGRLARVLGGDRWAAGLAGVAVAIVPVFLFLFHVLSMNAWDILLWTAVCLVVAQIVAEERPSLWPVAGVLIGLGLETKHSMAFLVFGLGVGVLLTPTRKWLLDRHLWIGAAIAMVMVAPHVWWQIANGWPTIEFVKNATEQKNVPLSPLQFVSEQTQIHPLNIVLLLAGLIFFFTAAKGRFRLFGWAYLAIFGLLVTQHGKAYYIAPIYPLMLSAGSVAFAAATAEWTWARRAIVTSMILGGVVIAPLTLPILPIDRYIRYADSLGVKPSSGERHQLAELPQHYADMFGWDEIVATVARVYNTLPPDDQSKAGVFVLNYGDAGAIDLLGPRHGLPKKAISPHNNYYLWGPGSVSGEVLIVVGGKVEDHLESYADVRQVDTIECGYCMPFENHRPVFILRKPIRPMDVIWRTSKIFI
jgi:hypothetical protein